MSVEEVRKLSRSLFESAGSAPRDFQSLMELLFSSTVFRQGETLVSLKEGNLYSLQGRPKQPILRLNDGNYLKFFMQFRFERNNVPLSVTEAAFQYQRDTAEFSRNFVFRYDYNIQPADKHPVSHLQINGKLDAFPGCVLKDIRFPVNRPSVESMLRLLIHDFGLKPNTDDWSEILTTSETAFLDYLAQKRTQQQ